VVREQGAEVQIRQDVAVQDQESFIQTLSGVGDGPTGAQRVGLGDPRDRGDVFAPSQALCEDLLEVRRREQDLVHAVPRQVVEHVAEKGTVHQRDERLGDRLGEGTKAGPFPAHQQDSLHRRSALTILHGGCAFCF
jgi:hypothetical protein